MRSSRFTLVILVLLIPLSGIFAQSEFMDKDQHGFGTEIEVIMNAAEFEQVGLTAGYSVNGLLDIGLRVGHSRGRTGIPGEESYRISASYGFTVLKQDRLVPLTIMVPGSLHAAKVVGESLDDAGLVKTGTGYRIGLEIFRYVYAAPRWYLRYGAFLDHESATYILERKNGVTGSGYPSSQKSYDLFYGLLLGFSFRPNRPNRGIVVSMDLKYYIEDDHSLRLAPSLSVTVVENNLEATK
ncbi:MAG: hypothetical protein K9L68_10325 [Spirochaetales bacterium]|nr:hypothetical protein [Spirochaetales bacterium]MCF7938979.1 hypothetical protein [Spirochaetales bacterium]